MAIIKSGVKATEKKDDCSYKVVQECGTISKRTYNSKNGEVTEELKLRCISWNDREPKYDIRPWEITSTGEKCLKMRGLTGEELEVLGDLINALKSEDNTGKTTKKKK